MPATPAKADLDADPFRITSSASSLLEVVRRAGIIARSELPKHSMLSQQSAHRLCEDLLSARLLQTTKPVIQGRGKPSVRLSLCPEGAYGLGVTIESDLVTVSVTNLVGDLLATQTLVVDANAPTDVTRASQVALEGLVNAHGIPKNRIAGLGVSMQGFRSVSPGVFTPPQQLSAWSDVNLDSTFSGTFDVPVFTGNNASLGAVAELWSGAGRSYSNFCYLSFNLGFGGGLVVNGAPFLGAHANAGENSSIYTPEEMERRPALESLIADLQEDGLDIRNISDLNRDYDPSWPAIDIWIDRVSPALRQMLRALYGILDPEAIVFGGEAPKDLRTRLIKAVQSEKIDRYGRPVPCPKLLVSGLEDNPSILGASLLPVRERLFN